VHITTTRPVQNEFWDVGPSGVIKKPLGAHASKLFAARKRKAEAKRAYDELIQQSRGLALARARFAVDDEQGVNDAFMDRASFVGKEYDEAARALAALKLERPGLGGL